MAIPKWLTKRIEDLEGQLKLATMFGDEDRVHYLQTQITKIEEKIDTREKVRLNRE